MSQQNSDTPISADGALEDKALDKESIIDLLGEEDDNGQEQEETLELDEIKKDGSKKSSEKAKGDTEEKEDTLEDELEEDLEEIDEDKLELTDAPSRKEILAAYPDLFKKFPQLEKSIYREKAYSELLPTIGDAREAVEKSALLDEYEQELLTGSTQSILAAVHDNDKPAFAKIVDNYLPNLFKVDQHAYYHTIGNVIKHTIVSMVKDSKEKSDDELSTAAAILNNYIFGTTKFTHPTNLSQEEVEDDGTKAKESEISQRERDFAERQYNTARDDLGVKVDNILKSSVDKAIDPNGSMTDYVKKNASREVIEGLEDLIAKDARFSSIYDRLWEKAFANDFDKESMDRIKAAYLSKARTLLPILIRKARNEAVRGINRNSDTTQRDRRGPLPVGKTRSSTTLAGGKSNNNSGGKSIPRGMSTLDFLNSDD